MCIKDSNKIDSKGNTVLMKAVKEGNIDWVTELIKDGARVDAKGKSTDGKRRSRRHSSAAREKAAAKYFFGGAT